MMLKNKDNHIPIVGDGAIATSEFGEGRLIPVLILDCKNHQDFLNFIYIHQSTPPGDVVSRWGYRRFNSQYVYLNLKFSKPVEVEINIKFDLREQAGLADQIVQARSVYLQPSDFGVRVSAGLGKPKIIVEVPPTTKFEQWDDMLLTQITKKIRGEGFSRKQARLIAEQHLARMREFLN